MTELLVHQLNELHFTITLSHTTSSIPTSYIPLLSLVDTRSDTTRVDTTVSGG